MNNVNLQKQYRELSFLLFQKSEKQEYPPKTKHYSPNNKYYFESETFSKPIDDGITFGNNFFVKIDIFENQSQIKIGKILTNYHETAHLWMSKSDEDFLFLSEFQFGISVFNLTTKTLNSYISEADWQQIHQYYPSPDSNKLAIVKFSNSGYALEVFDCSETMNLPYPTLYKKHLTEPNGHYVESINWLDNFYFDIITKEGVRLGKTMLKVEVVAVSDDGFRAECRFKDIYGKEYIAYEKTQAMFDFLPNEATNWPISSFIDASLISSYTENGIKYTIISTNIGTDYHTSGEIKILESQIIITWYYKDFFQTIPK